MLQLISTTTVVNPGTNLVSHFTRRASSDPVSRARGPTGVQVTLST